MKLDLTVRKNIRLRNYCYNENGYYFITVCTNEMKKLLCRGEHCSPENDNKFELSETGLFVDTAINNIPSVYSDIRVDKYIIMPNHLHMILIIESNDANGCGRTLFAPTISRVIKHAKGWVTKQIGQPIWQTSYYDRIIRNEKEYQEIWKYIDTNPLMWELDKYYQE